MASSSTVEEEEEEEETFHCCNDSDEYHDDSLPDLVVECSSNNNNNNHKSAPSSNASSFDLLENHARQTTVEQWDPEGEYSGAAGGGGAGNQEIITEVSSSNTKVFKISFVDHSKAYVPKTVGSNERYRSYLCLTTADGDGDKRVPDHLDLETPTTPTTENRERQTILDDFRALSFDGQRQQRAEWARELARTEDEIAELKEKLAVRTAWRGVLRRSLQQQQTGVTTATTVDEWGKKIECRCKEVAAKAMRSKVVLLQPLQMARESFEVLSREVRERVRQGREEVARKVAHFSLRDEEESGRESACDAKENSARGQITVSDEGKVNV